MRLIEEILTLAGDLADGVALSSDDGRVLLDTLRSMPYFTVAAVVLLRHLPTEWRGDEQLVKELRHSLALSASCRRTVLYAAKGEEQLRFYPEQEDASAPPTEDVIDIFLRTYGQSSPEEDAQLEKLIFNPAPDYAEMLARQEQEELPSQDEAVEPGSQDALINAFILTRHPARQEEAETPAPAPKQSKPIAHPEHTDDSLLSESLAKIFIKQGRYERAFEIISGLYLKFPKKSAYFADQLRFLQKLIINQRRLAELNGGETSANTK